MLKALDQIAICHLLCDSCEKFDAQSRARVSFAQRLLKQFNLERDTKQASYVEFTVYYCYFQSLQTSVFYLRPCFE